MRHGVATKLRLGLHGTDSFHASKQLGALSGRASSCLTRAHTLGKAQAGPAIPQRTSWTSLLSDGAWSDMMAFKVKNVRVQRSHLHVTDRRRHEGTHASSDDVVTVPTACHLASPDRTRRRAWHQGSKLHQLLSTLLHSNHIVCHCACQDIISSSSAGLSGASKSGRCVPRPSRAPAGGKDGQGVQLHGIPAA